MSKITLKYHTDTRYVLNTIKIGPVDDHKPNVLSSHEASRHV